ncbi:AI-2E family transporter [Gryllotalpicola protaetiae]|uniref:AI-2E family transporter n=1 Tax=Gryllotalpicola protaetiae TaxID=2419771 RepID=A0A387BMM5_9MICO|nr:AI-2E family transporter [Gryllotalpicola protaetiae]AYG02266.1 AI-2E family transporter [Gryllotalpicola protaetiae]
MAMFSRNRVPSGGALSRNAATARAETTVAWGDGFGRFATRCIQIIAVLIVVAVAVVAITHVSLVFIPVTLALILACAIHPFLAWMRRHGLPSMLATWIALFSILIVIGGLTTLIVWAVEAQWDSLVQNVTDGVNQLEGYFNQLPANLISQKNLHDAQNAILGFLTSAQFGRGALAGVGAAAEGVTGLFLTIVTLFFFMKDGPKIWGFLLRPLHGETYHRALRIGEKTVSVLGGYVRGTAMVAAADAVGIGIGLAIVGVPLAFPLAVIVFITAFIPIVGAVLAGVLAALVALVTNGPFAAVIVIAIVVLVNQLESHLLQPQIMGHSLNLHPLVILLALAAGSIIGGIVGAVLAVPLAATAWGIVTVWNAETGGPFATRAAEEVPPARG